MAVHTENDIEVELKLLVSEDAGDIIQQQLLPLLDGKVEQSEIELSNDYFDTPERTLRKHNIGFRIRGSNGVFEQTLKTAGKTVGGLHQRPEFNIPLAQPIMSLSLFDKKVWPLSVDVDALQESLSAIFSTRFTRHIYLIKFTDGAVVELAWDKGEVVAGRKHEQICEIELELKHGNAEKLFVVAKQIVALMPIKIGNASKAARGYALSDGTSNTPKSLPGTIELAPDDSIETAFARALELGLAQWQMHETQFHMHSDAFALHNMYQAIELILSALAEFQSELACKPITDLYHKLESWLSNWHWLNEYYAYSLFASSSNVHSKKLAKSPQLVSLLQAQADQRVVDFQPTTLLLSATNVGLQLEIAEFLVTMPWRQTSARGTSALQDFALQHGKQQQKTIIELLSTHQFLRSEDYLSNAKTIRDAALQGYLFDISPTSRYKQCYALCRDLVIGINELELWLQLQRLIELSNIDDKESYITWCSTKMSSLYSVMERSRQEFLNAQFI